MKITNLSAADRKALRGLKALEGQSMTFEELKDSLERLFGTCWAHSDEDYNDEDSEESCFMIHSLDDIECEEPFKLPDSSETHIRHSLVWEIFFVNHNDREGISLDDRITVDDVMINVPKHLFRWDDRESFSESLHKLLTGWITLGEFREAYGDDIKYDAQNGIINIGGNTIITNAE